MNGYVICMVPCYFCDTVFGCNPHKVPSVKDKDGVKQAVCEACHKRCQEYQREKGAKIWPDPLPGAYDVAPESEVF